MKTCRKCGLEKSEDEFYGYHVCKQCKKEYQKSREKNLRESNPEWIESERNRGRDKYYRLNYWSKYRPSYEAKKATMEKYKQKYPEKQLAKQATCDMERKEGFELHHWSYNEDRYKDVIELDFKSHAKIHRYMKYDPLLKMYRSLEGCLLDSRDRHLEYIGKVLIL